MVIIANPIERAQVASEFPPNHLLCLVKITEAPCPLHGMLGRWNQDVRVVNPYRSHLYVTTKIPGHGNQNCDKLKGNIFKVLTKNLRENSIHADSFSSFKAKFV